jgi:hypothetical protein
MTYDPRKRMLLDDGEHYAQMLRLPADFDFASVQGLSWGEIQKRIRAGFDALRERPSGPSGPSGRRINARSKEGGPFVAIDSEGVNFGEPFLLRNGKRKAIDPNNPPTLGKGDSIRQLQKTVLWMAGGAPGFEDVVLSDPNGLERERIWEMLLSLPRHFAGKHPSDPAPIFTGFGFSYDFAQLVLGMSYEDAWSIYHGIPWEKRDDPNYSPAISLMRVVGDYAISYIPRKCVTLAKLRDPNQIWRRWKNKKTGEAKRELNISERIVIYDTFGFFQSSLIKAIKNFPGVVTEAELETIKEGKKKRGDFTADDLPMLQRYTGAELKALAAMMTKLREGFNIPNPATGEPEQLKIRNWWGAGAIAQALLKKNLGPRPAHILGDMSKPWPAIDAVTGEARPDKDALDWATYARFGGRIELCMQGVSRKPIYMYDIASAYPSICVKLPSMEGGRWVYKQNPTREEVENSNILSMFRVSTKNFKRGLPFYPLPFRTEAGDIMIPPNVISGRYMRDDVIAAFKYFDRFMTDRSLWDGVAYRGRAPEIIVSEAMFFIPADETTRPLAFVGDLFDLRASIVKVDKKDIRGQVMKLGINSVYGKTAQSVGKPGEPPPYGSLWYAAAITAGTRRKAVEAALTDPWAIIAFATDAVFSTCKLPLDIPPTKILGEWEFEQGRDGSIVQSGVYTIRPLDPEGKLKTGSRGFKPREDDMNVADDFAQALDRELFEDVPRLWREGRDAYEFEDDRFIGLGDAIVSRNAFKYLCHWKTSMRELRLNDMSGKRRAPASEKLRRERANKLIHLEVRPYEPGLNGRLPCLLTESAPSVPEWMLEPGDPRRRRRKEVGGGVDDENVIAKFDDGSDPEF